jgi:hypothetical protein
MILAVVLLVGIVSTADAAGVKAGGACSKAGITSSAASGTFFCVSSGKKLVWSSPVPETGLAPSEDCRLQKVYDGPMNIAFPRTSVAKDPSHPKILIVSYVFSDTQSGALSQKTLQESAKAATKLYAEESYGRMNLSFQTLPIDPTTKVPTVLMAGSYKDIFQSTANSTVSVVLNNFLKSMKPEWHAEDYDVVWFTTTDRRTSMNGYAAVSDGNGESDKLYSVNGGLVRSAIVSSVDPIVISHELGHALLRFIDLYTGFTKKWELMGDGMYFDNHFIVYEKWISSWVDDSQLRCVTQSGPSIHYISNSAIRNGLPKAVMIKRSPSTAIMIEARSTGVIGYSVDVTKRTQQGAIKVIDNNGKAFASGSKSFTIDGATFTVLNCDAMGCLVKVSNSLSATAESPSNSNAGSSQATTPSNPSTAILNISGIQAISEEVGAGKVVFTSDGVQSSYVEVFVINTNDSVFKSPINNNSASEQTVVVANLKCDVQYRTEVTIYSGRDGQGSSKKLDNNGQLRGKC